MFPKSRKQPRHQPLRPHASVHGGYVGIHAQRPQFVHQDGLARAAEAQRRRDLFARRHQALCQPVEGRHAHAAAHQQRPRAGSAGVEAVAKAGEQVERRAGAQAGELLRARADHLVDKHHLARVPVADADGAAQVQPFNFHVDELPRPHDGRGVARQRHAQRAVGDAAIFRYGKQTLFHAASLCVDGGDGQRRLFQHVEQHLHRVQRGKHGHVVFHGAAADLVAVG